ncbi:DUF6838 family protein [Paenibacillus sp. BR1-192]|uniref:phage tail terminator family protein n=1 Tax=Paenibacillus sp. BR1-192 TaxID=3032287 RepID=UPI00240D066A|nr:hypothetical protein [Paenibacillus sp. BR1-192]WFB60575.1 hypothetical protein P0X86_10380 [Paenibacillus sp. BR1-192]
MLQVNFNDVRYAVHAALDAAFPDVEIMGEEIKQGLTPPCFFVRFLEPEHMHLIGRRYMRYHPMVIRYYAVDQTNASMYSMAEDLTRILERISISGALTKGTGIRFEIVDGVLHFFVEYNFHVMKPKDPAVKMERIEQEGRLK